jgi:DNA-binding NtrC family response regulator
LFNRERKAMKIIIADRSSEIIILFLLRFKDSGHESYGVKNTAELEHLHEKHGDADLVIVDWNLPPEGAVECLQNIRGLYPEAKIWVTYASFPAGRDTAFLESMKLDLIALKTDLIKHLEYAGILTGHAG